jgi:hypothetical protein
MKEHSHLQAKELAEIQPLLLYIGPLENDWSTLTLGVTTQALTMAFWSTHEVLHRTAVHPLGLRVLPTQAPQSCHVSPASNLPDAPGSCLRPSILRSWLCGETKEPDGFVVNHHEPRRLCEASTPSCFWLGRNVVPTQCWFCGQTNETSWSTLWSNWGTRRFSGELPKTLHQGIASPHQA